MNKAMDNNNFKDIRRAIVRTIAFFDIFDFPLTWFEVWKYLPIKTDLSVVQAVLLDNGLDVVSNKNGFFFLSGREEIVATRMKRYNYANIKYKKTLRIIRIFKYIPWIKMVCIGNILGANNLKQESDIDFFVITERNRIWLTRFFCVVVAELLRVRPKQNDFKDKICLSFFSDVEKMNFKGLMIGEDEYLAHWLADLLPVYNKSRTYEEFIDHNNWMRQKLPNWQPTAVSPRISIEPSEVFYRDVVDMLIGGLEKIAKNIQLKLMPQNIKEVMNSDTKVVVNDQMLKFHINDRRQEYNDLFTEKIKTLYDKIP